MASIPFSCKHDGGERCAKWCGSDWACSDGEIDHEHEQLKAALAAEQVRAERLAKVLSDCVRHIKWTTDEGRAAYDAARAALALRPSGDGVG